MNFKRSFLLVVLVTSCLCFFSSEVNAQLFRGKGCRLFSCRQQCRPCPTVQSCTSYSCSVPIPYPCEFPLEYCKCVERGGSQKDCHDKYCLKKYGNPCCSQVVSGACCPCQTCYSKFCWPPFPCWHPLDYCRCVRDGGTPKTCDAMYCTRRYGDPRCPPSVGAICFPSQSCCSAPPVGRKRCRIFRRCR